MNTVSLPGAKAVFVHDNPQQLSVAAAQRIEELSAQAITARGVFRLVLAGGETPRRCYEELRRRHLDWAHIEIYFGDERCVPRGDAQRNDKIAHETLLKHVAIPPGNIHAIPAEHGARAAAAEYAALLEHAQPFDLVLLGMGEDGHTASLFPGNPATEQADSVVPVFDSPKPPPERVSLGMGTLNAAREKLFLTAGTGKREALKRITRGEALPAARVARAEWHIDRAAWPDEQI